MSDARRRVLAVLAERPVALDVEQVRESIGGHPNGIRRHLAALVAAGLVVREVRTPGRVDRTDRPGRAGRPSHEYRASALGARAHALGRAPGQATGYAAIAGSLVAALEGAATPGRAVEVARAAGRAWGDRRPAGGGPAAAARAAGPDEIVAVLAGQGYDPAPTDATTVRLRACPMLDLALEHPDVVCAVHLGLLEGLAGSEVTLEPLAGPDGCVIRLAGPGAP